MLFLREVEQFGESATVWKSCVWISELVEVWVNKTSKWSWSGLWIVLKKLSYEVNGFSWGSVSEYFFPRKWSNLREAIFFIIWIHSLNLLLAWSTQDLDNFNQLVDTTFSREDWLPKHKLSDDTAY